MAYDYFLLIHSCIAFTLLFGIYQYWYYKYETQFTLLLPIMFIFLTTWAIAAAFVLFPHSVLECLMKLGTVLGVWFGFIALTGFVAYEKR